MCLYRISYLHVMADYTRNLSAALSSSDFLVLLAQINARPLTAKRIASSHRMYMFTLVHRRHRPACGATSSLGAASFCRSGFGSLLCLGFRGDKRVFLVGRQVWLLPLLLLLVVGLRRLAPTLTDNATTNVGKKAKKNIEPYNRRSSGPEQRQEQV